MGAKARRPLRGRGYAAAARADAPNFIKIGSDNMNATENNGAISDNRILHMYQNYLSEHHKYDDRLKSFRLCGSQGNKNPAFQNHIVITRSKSGAKSSILGLNSCHSSWGCPRCTAKILMNYGIRIAAAIDALATKNLIPFMVTFTMPHHRKMPCKLTFDILRNAWQKFRRENKKARYKTDRKNYRGANPYGKFCEELGIKYFVKMYEFTWGEDNGWHPHIHAIYWVPAHNLSKVKDYHQSLIDYWWNCLKKSSVQELNKIYPEEILNNKRRVDEYYTDWRKNPVTEHRCVYIEFDEKNCPVKEVSAKYVSGVGEWLAYEVSGSTTTTRKIAAEGHFNIWQLFEKAYDDLPRRDFWLELITEYFLATRGHKRLSLTPGLNSIVKQWHNIKGYEAILKKKDISDTREKWQVVTWFTKEQWYNIYCLNLKYGTIIDIILELAKLDNGFHAINKMLEMYGLEKVRRTKRFRMFKEYFEHNYLNYENTCSYLRKCVA